MKVSDYEKLGRNSRVWEHGRRRLVQPTRKQFSVLPASQIFYEGSSVSIRLFSSQASSDCTDYVASSVHHRSSRLSNGTG